MKTGLCLSWKIENYDFQEIKSTISVAEPYFKYPPPPGQIQIEILNYRFKVKDSWRFR